jgi:SnoaL-like domain
MLTDVEMLDPPVGGELTVVVDRHVTPTTTKENPMTVQLSLDPVIASHIAAINSFDLDAIMDTFAEDALVNDAAREFWGRERIRAFVAKELVGDRVTLQPVESVDNAGMWCVRCRYDGDYDKTGLPDPLIMTNYLRVQDGKIVTLFIVNNTAPQY